MHSNRIRKRIEWTASTLHPRRMIASPTLAALRALLDRVRVSAAATPPSDAAPVFSVRLDDLPDLAEVGGVAMVWGAGREPLGVARVGRSSFVGFRLEGDGLREIDVELDESNGNLRIDPAAGYPAEAPPS